MKNAEVFHISQSVFQITTKIFPIIQYKLNALKYNEIGGVLIFLTGKNSEFYC